MATLGFFDRLKTAWNVFKNKDPSNNHFTVEGYINGSTARPDTNRLTGKRERSVISSIFNRIAVDVSSIDVRHVRVDVNGRYLNTIDSTLNRCLTLQANQDQTGRDLIRDITLSMFDEGCVAIVPVFRNIDPGKNTSEILALRTGRIKVWYPDWVNVELYNDRKGVKETIDLRKKDIAIVENPFYSIMNQPNAIFPRLLSKLNALDRVDSKVSSGKLDVIIQVPYLLKSESRKRYAKERLDDLTAQLSNSEMGIAYLDGTEKVVQLNRAVENTFLNQIEYFTKMVYTQLGVSENILTNTASDQESTNYTNRILEPILTAIVESMSVKFISQTARTQGQTIMFFRNPFKLTPVNEIANIADKFTRNEILSSNDFRAIVGYRPSEEPRADELVNKNIRQPDEESNKKETILDESKWQQIMNMPLNKLNKQ